MARQRRIFAPGLLYHVIARGNQRRATFLDDADYRAYLRRLALYRERYHVRLHAYCLMPNHVHLLVRTAETPLAKFMQGLQQSYTQRFNRVHDTVGHLFQGRYRAIVCDSERYLLVLVRYIHLNPVRAGLAAQPEDYPYSGHRAYLGQPGPGLIDPAPVLGLLGGAAAYARFVAEASTEGHRADLYPVAGTTLAGAEAAPAALPAARAGPPSAPREPLEDAAGRLAAGLGADLADLRAPGRSRSLAAVRRALAWALVRRLAYRLTDVAALLGRDPATLSVALARRGARAPGEAGGAADPGLVADYPKSKV
jgi:REP element-mobilizing transposase RayT